MWIKIYALFLSALSLCAFIAYAADKSRAKKGARRIPERVLLALSLSGGAAGGDAAMFVCRHKTRKWYFHAVNLLGILWQALALVFLIRLS